jgi:hypothetical protein
MTRPKLLEIFITKFIKDSRCGVFMREFPDILYSFKTTFGKRECLYSINKEKYILRNFINVAVIPLPLLVGCFLWVPCLAYSSAMNIEAVRSSETSMNFHRTSTLLQV